MAIPTQPTLTTLCTEGIKKAGYPSPSSAQLTRAEDWVEETKNDLWNLEKRWKPLMIMTFGVTADGKSRYAMPSDFEQDLSVVILDGTHTGTLQAGAAGTATLASSESMTTDYAQGKLLLITAGTGLGSCSQMTGWNNTTKVATVTPDFTVTPAVADSYTVVDVHYPLRQSTIWDRDGDYYPHDSGIPTHYFPIGQGNADADESGEFELYPIPDDIYGIQIRYYANLMLLDLTSEVLKGLYRRWRNVFIQGVYMKQLQNDRNAKYYDELKIYRGMIDELRFKDAYGMSLSEMQVRIVE